MVYAHLFEEPFHYGLLRLRREIYWRFLRVALALLIMPLTAGFGAWLRCCDGEEVDTSVWRV